MKEMDWTKHCGVFVSIILINSSAMLLMYSTVWAIYLRKSHSTKYIEHSVHGNKECKSAVLQGTQVIGYGWASTPKFPLC